MADIEGSESEYESDVEFILGAPSSRKDVAAQAPTVTQAAAPGTEVSAVPQATAPTTASSDGSQPSAPKREIEPIDIDAIGEYEGKPITQLSMAEFEDKPWRRPGVDVTDYFNYGFDEFTWQAYCSKQDHIRANYTPQKVMGMMGMPPMFMPGLMPPMPSGPGMPGMPGMPQMSGMPPMSGMMPPMPGPGPGMPGQTNSPQPQLAQLQQNRRRR